MAMADPILLEPIKHINTCIYGAYQIGLLLNEQIHRTADVHKPFIVLTDIFAQWACTGHVYWCLN